MGFRERLAEMELERAPKKSATATIMTRREQVRLFAPVLLRNILDGQLTPRSDLRRLLPEGYSDSGAAKTVGDTLGGHDLGVWQTKEGVMASRSNGLLIIDWLTDVVVEEIATEMGFEDGEALVVAVEALVP